MTTPVEMLAAINAVANGGVWVQPHVVDAIINPEHRHDHAVRARDPPRHLGHRSDYPRAHDGRRGERSRCRGVQGAKIPGYSMEIAGKTGTAQVALPNGGGYGPNVVASFVGFMPATNPQFTMMVILNNPQVNARRSLRLACSPRRSGSRWPR